MAQAHRSGHSHCSTRWSNRLIARFHSRTPEQSRKAPRDRPWAIPRYSFLSFAASLYFRSAVGSPAEHRDSPLDMHGRSNCDVFHKISRSRLLHWPGWLRDRCVLSWVQCTFRLRHSIPEGLVSRVATPRIPTLLANGGSGERRRRKNHCESPFRLHSRSAEV